LNIEGAGTSRKEHGRAEERWTISQRIVAALLLSGFFLAFSGSFVFSTS
jgi:hypothetical protein